MNVTIHVNSHVGFTPKLEKLFFMDAEFVGPKVFHNPVRVLVMGQLPRVVPFDDNPP
jgi:hypothetical protein